MTPPPCMNPLGIYLRGMKVYVQAKICTQALNAALFESQKLRAI